jgi:hypothetical protein
MSCCRKSLTIEELTAKPFEEDAQKMGISCFYGMPVPFGGGGRIELPTQGYESCQFNESIIRADKGCSVLST